MSTLLTVLAVVAWLAIGPVVAIVICKVIDHRDEQRARDVISKRREEPEPW